MAAQQVSNGRMKRSEGLSGLVLTTALLLLSSACSTLPPQREVKLPSQVVGEPVSDNGLHRLVIFNDSNRLLFGLDDSAKINVFLDGKGVGQVDIGQYVVIEVPSGENTLEFVRDDLGTFRSAIHVNVSGEYTFLRVHAKPASNAAEVMGKPDDFDKKFRAAYPPTGSGEGEGK